MSESELDEINEEWLADLNLSRSAGASEAKAVREKSFARELYFSSSRVALIQIAAPFGVDCLPIQPRNFSFSVSGPWRDRSSAQSANVIIKPNFPL
jgi:hypothetical protein